MGLCVGWATSRRDVGLRNWARWMHEDLGSGAYHWLRADYVPPSPYLVIKDKETKTSSVLRFLLQRRFRGLFSIFRALSVRPGSSKLVLSFLSGKVFKVPSFWMFVGLDNYFSLPTFGNVIKCC